MSERPTSSVRDAESLLDQVVQSALDDDYYQRPTRPPSIRSKMLTALVTGALGLLVAVAIVQTRNDRPATQLERSALIDNIRDSRALAQSRQSNAQQLQSEIAELEAASQVERPGTTSLRVTSGAIAVTGPGMVVRVESADGDDEPYGQVTDSDVQLIVNGLWLAGAEAVAIDGHRLTSTSAIRSAGEAITVNYKSVTEPIVISAIGDPDTIVVRWRNGPSGRYMADRAKDDAIRYSVRGSDEVDLPAAPDSRLAISAEPLRRPTS